MTTFLLTTFLVIGLAIGCDSESSARSPATIDAGLDASAEPDADVINATDAQIDSANVADGDADAEATDAGDAAEPPPPDNYCGDALRDPSDEECDDGTPATSDSCDEACRVTQVVASEELPVADTLLVERGLGRSAHPVAGNESGILVSYSEKFDTGAQRTLVRRLTAHGGPIGEPVVIAEMDSELSSDPAVAGLPTGSFAIAWASAGAVSPDVMIAAFDFESGVLGGDAVAHASGAGPQGSPDLLWTGHELVLAYSDLLDVYVRRFDSNLAPVQDDEPIANTAALETSVALATFGSTFAISYRSMEDGVDRIFVRAADTVWWTTPVTAAGDSERPALLALDESTLLLVFAVATEDGSRLRMATLHPSASGELETVALEAVEPDFNAAGRNHARPRLVSGEQGTFVAWEIASPSDEKTSEVVVVQELTVSPITYEVLIENEMMFPLSSSTSLKKANPALAIVPNATGESLAVLWEERGEAPGNAVPIEDIALELRPLPMTFIEPR